LRLSRPLAALCAALFAALALPSALSAAPPPLELQPEEAARVERGETVVREGRDPRSLALRAEGATADGLRARVAALKPNYISEVVFAAPEREGAVEELAQALADVGGYVGIKYWSKRQGRYYDLFDKMAISSRKPIEGGEEIEVRQHMEPFTEFGCRYSYRVESTPAGKALYFECRNTSAIAYSYRGIDAVSPGKMLWALYAFPHEGRIVFYGVGAVKAFDMFGAVRDRLKTSFLGRIEAFFGSMSARLGPAQPEAEKE
jgi:hypothetical protein